MCRAREKPFDAVRMMREIRDRLSRQIKDMSFEEQQRFLGERLREGEPRSSGPQSDAGAP